MSVANNLDDRTPSKAKPKKRLQNPLTVTQRATSSPSGKAGAKPSKSTMDQDRFTADDLDLDAELEEDDEFEGFDDSEDNDEDYRYDEDADYGAIEELADSEVYAVSETSDFSDFDRHWTESSAFGEGEPRAEVPTSDHIAQLRDDLERNQVFHVLQNLREHPSLLNHNFGGITTLKLVVQRRSLELLKAVLAQPELDINETYEHKRNLAHWLLEEVEPLENHHVECLQAVMELRPDFAFCTEDAAGFPPLYQAIWRAYSHAQSAALRLNDPESAQKSRSQMEQYLRCVRLLARGDPNVCGGRTRLPVLSLAIQLAFLEAFDILMDENVDTNMQDAAGDTPLHHLIARAMHGMNFARAVVAGRDPSQLAPLHTHHSPHHMYHHSHAFSSHMLHHHSPTMSAGKISPSASSSSSLTPPVSALHLATSMPTSPPAPSSSNQQASSNLVKHRSLDLMRPELTTLATSTATASSNPGSISNFMPSANTGITSPRNGGTTSPMSLSASVPSGAVRRPLSLSSSDLEELVLGGSQMNEAVRRMCTALLEGRANVFIANLQQQTPYAKALLRPDIHMIFEAYNPGSKVWKHRIESLLLGERIGVGSFGEVYLARMQGSEFAVKMIKAAEASTYEAGIMSDIRHPNVLTFIGIYIPPPELQQQLFNDSGVSSLDSTDSLSSSPAEYRIGIVTEYLQMGSLSAFLGFHRDRSPTPTIVAWPVMMRIALTVARGMAWLHSREPPIYHHDLHAGNVLLATEFGDTKLCDFGLSRVRGRAPAQSYNRIRAPEAALGPASDVYSFGFLLYQLLYADKGTKERIKTLQDRIQNNAHMLDASPGHEASPPLESEEWAAIDTRVKRLRPWTKPPPGFRLLNPDPWPPGSAVCYLDIQYLIVECTDSDPMKRPSFLKIIEDLERLSKPRSILAQNSPQAYFFPDVSSSSYSLEDVPLALSTPSPSMSMAPNIVSYYEDNI